MIHAFTQYIPEIAQGNYDSFQYGFQRINFLQYQFSDLLTADFYEHLGCALVGMNMDSLNLDYSTFNSDDCAISVVLNSQNSSITKFSFSHTNLTAKGAIEIAKLLRGTKVKSFDVTGLEFSKEELLEILSHLQLTDVEDFRYGAIYKEKSMNIAREYGRRISLEVAFSARSNLPAPSSDKLYPDAYNSQQQLNYALGITSQFKSQETLSPNMEIILGYFPHMGDNRPAECIELAAQRPNQPETKNDEPENGSMVSMRPG